MVRHVDVEREQKFAAVEIAIGRRVSPIHLLLGHAPVLAWAQNHLAQPLSVEDFARKAAMSPRTFAWRFREQAGTTPHQWLTHQRLFAAQRRLETTEATIDQIAEAVGLQTAATLRQHFSRTLSTTPTAYRRRFRLRPPR
jgi:transcriptional regulator GlxA family with amidase domain